MSQKPKDSETVKAQARRELMARVVELTKLEEMALGGGKQRRSAAEAFRARRGRALRRAVEAHPVPKC